MTASRARQITLLTIAFIPCLEVVAPGADASATTPNGRFAVKSLARNEDGRRQATGSFVLHRKTQTLSLHSRGTSGHAPEPAAMYTLQAMLSTPTTKILVYPADKGQAWAESGRWELKAQVETIPAGSIKVKAGVFANCVKHTTVITNTRKSSNENDFVNGKRFLWFAPGVGLVKMDYHHADGTHTTAQLVQYSLSSDSQDLWPLSLTNEWTYQWQSEYRDEPVYETWTVVPVHALESKQNPQEKPLPVVRADYTVTITEQARRLARVQCEIIPRLDQPGIIELFLKNAHASNQPDGFAHYIHDFRATDLQDTSLEVDQPTRDQWRIHVKQPGPVHVTYTVLLNHDHDHWQYGPDEAPYVREDCVFWSASALFIAPRHEPDHLQVTFQVPDDWHVSTAWQSLDPSRHVFRLDHRDELIETYLATGPYESALVKSGNTEVLLAVGGDMERPKGILFETVDGFLQAYTRLFDGAPDRRLLVVAHRNLQRSGMDGGVYGSSVSMLFPERLSRNNLGQWAPFVGHELFHVWNGQAITYQDQEYWFSEGFTDYYCQVLALRLGHISEEAFLDNLKKACTKYLSKQGVLSLHKAGENKSAHFDLVYEGGKLVAAVLDLQIRQLTNNQKCLDDLMRRMYQRFGSTDQGYTQDDILAIIEDLTGRDYRDFLADYISGTARLPLEEAFDQAGLKLEVTVEEELPSLDFVVFKMLRINSLSHNRMLIKRSAQAGYQDGDCLLAIDEKPVKSVRDLQRMAQRLQPGQSVQLTLKRADQRLTQSMLLGGQGQEIPIERKVSARLTKLKAPTEKQERILAGILRQ